MKPRLLRRKKSVREFAKGRPFLKNKDSEARLKELIAEVGLGRTLDLISKEYDFPINVRDSINDLDDRLKKVEAWMKNRDALDFVSLSRTGKLSTNEEDYSSYEDFAYWQQVLAQLALRVSKPSFDTWLRNTKAKQVDEDLIIVICQNEFQKDWLSQRYKQEIFFTVKEVAGKTYEIEMECG